VLTAVIWTVFSAFLHSGSTTVWWIIQTRNLRLLRWDFINASAAIVWNLCITVYFLLESMLTIKEVKFSLWLTKHYATKTYGEVDVQIHILLTSTLVGGEWLASLPFGFTPWERAPGTHCIGSWMDPTFGLDDMEKWKFLTLPVFENRPLGRPARWQSLYRYTVIPWFASIIRSGNVLVIQNTRISKQISP
jgi:hypothetical protein